MPTASEHGCFQSSKILLEKLATVLPEKYNFGIYHLSTPPTKTDALFHAPLGAQPDRTYRESHFLSVTIDTESAEASHKSAQHGTSVGEVIVFALEIFIFSTAYSSTFFVSKADSSGYLHLLHLPKNAPSPIREVCSTFISYLVEQRRRRNVQSVVTLFARAQSQYLFPRSVDNPGKHVLDDRGLVKWWCRVLNPLLAEQLYEPEEHWRDVKGYLTVPGLDHYETRAYLPRTPGSAEKWTVGYPLEEISHYCRELANVPPRCLIPQYPDDPKARFRDELDDEAEKAEQGDGSWRSVQTLEQFWEMMAFRQECSSGRLTGFIWLVFNPNDAGLLVGTHLPQDEREQAKKKSKHRRKALKGHIVARLPRIKTQQRNYLVNRPESTAYFFWPPEGRGKLIVDETDYKRIVELLLQLDFSNLEKAIISTSRWTKEAGMGTDWRLNVDGRVQSEIILGDKRSQAGSLPKRKRAPSDVNTLGGSLIRRKKKDSDNELPTGSSGLPTRLNPPTGTANEADEPTVNKLDSGLIRKKSKT